ncbi:MAG TPA: hypothetical protein VE776_02260 [Actinomycetota bacterium]|jgi:hypothetical protein|nr:hypothetical protein [Actinomycetota bacterium]
MWEYTIREFVQEWGDPGEGRAAATFLADLNELGSQGWEAVGLAPRTHYDRGGGPGGWDSYTFVVLLKRRLAETAPETRSGGQPALAEEG